MAQNGATIDRKTDDAVLELDTEALAVFADKGHDAPGVSTVARQANGNGVKVRRIMQLTLDLSNKPADQLRILDLGCGDGVYTIEAGGRGSQVLAVDGRTVRMENGIKIAQRHNLSQISFVQEDVRKLTKATHGEFDVIWNLGILYHLDVPDLFTWLENLYAMCRDGGFMIVDTHIAPRIIDQAEHRGRKYDGMRTREHEDAETEEQRRAKTFRSLDNTFNFLFSRDALVRLLNDVGFTSVMEVFAPLETAKRIDRVTLVATKGQKVRLSTYPWVNDKSEDEIAATLRPANPQPESNPTPRGGIGPTLNRAFRKLGFEIKRT